MDAFIDVLLPRLLATSVQTALLATTVWALCRYVPRLSPATQCWLWWLVALQALLGLIANPIELPWLPQAPAVLPKVATAAQWTATTRDSVALTPLAIEYARPWWPAAVFALWMSGLLLMAWITLRKWRRGHWLLQHSVPCTDTQLLRILASTTTGGSARVPQLRFSQDIDSPLLIGALRPALLLPAITSLSSEELEMAVAHELAHLRRGDLWWGWVPTLARSLFFFHPLAHLAVREYGIAREAACDAAVVDADHRSRRDYGRLLLRLGTTGESGTGLAAASPTFHALKRRLNMLQHTYFQSRAVSILLLAIVAIIGVMPLRLVAATAPTPVRQAAPAAQATAPQATAPAADARGSGTTSAPPTTTAASPAATREPARSQPQEVAADQQKDRELTRRFLELELRTLKLRLEAAQAEQEKAARERLQSGVEAQPRNGNDAAVQGATANQAEAAALATRSENLRKQYEELRARMEKVQALHAEQQREPTLTLQTLVSSTSRRLQPESRPGYAALYTRYTTACSNNATQGADGQAALQRANCLEQAELRAYYETLAAEKEAQVEQRRKAAMGLSSGETTTK